MGTQQLFLLVLGIVIVGLAVIAGVGSFRQQTKANQADDALSRSVAIAQEAVNWRGRAVIYGGGGGGNFTPLATNGLEILGIGDAPAYTEHAIQSASGNVLEIVGVSTLDTDVGAYVRVTGDQIDSTATRLDGSITLP
ncbi:MAG: hypothetical protein AAFQ43_09000 [Bacteroidota bacterium]